MAKENQLSVRFTERQRKILQKWGEILECSEGEVVRKLVSRLGTYTAKAEEGRLDPEEAIDIAAKLLDAKVDNDPEE